MFEPVSDAGAVLERLTAVIASRRPEAGGNPQQSYVASLLQRGPDAFLKKVGEEAAEVVMAAKDAQHGSGAAERITSEVADLWFHCMVALAYYGLSARDVLQELARREGLSGLEEKARRGAKEESHE